MAKDAYSKEEKLKKMVANVDSFREYFKENVRRYHYQRKFLYKSAIEDSERAVLAKTNKPPLEFNVSEAYISRKLGEFSKQEPSITTSAIEGMPVDEKQLEFVGDHLRYQIACESARGWQYNTFDQTLSGGFSAWKIWTEYSSSLSFEQIIKFGLVFDPTMIGFDVLAQHSTKCDGSYCYELFPKTKDELEEMGLDVRNVKEVPTNTGYNWTYRNLKDTYILVCDYYEKLKKRMNILLLPDKVVMREKEYNQMKKDWEEQGRIEQLPRVLATRRTDEIYVKRYQFTQNSLISEEDTDFEFLPIIFVDGNSKLIKDSNDSPVEQVTRGYTYNLMGAQRLKNFSGQALAGELQNIVQHKWVVAKEAIPAQYEDAYIDAQVASVLVYNHLYNDDPNIVLPPPREVARTPIPPIIVETFQLMDNLSQMIMGSFDSSRELGSNQLSGVAIGKREMQSNTASLPHNVKYMEAMTQLGKCYSSLLPKIIKTPRTMPVLSADNRKGYVNIAPDEKGAVHPDTIYINYEPSAIDVRIEAGIDFAIQKSQAIGEMIMMAKEMPVFNAFMNEKGLSLLVDNMDIKGAEQLREMSLEYMQEIEQKKQEASKQPSPEQIQMQLTQKKMEIEQSKVAQGEKDLTIKAAKVGVDEYDAETKRMSAEAKANTMQQEIAVKHAKAQAENIRSAADVAISEAAHHHNVRMDKAELHHKVVMDHKPKE